MMHTCFFCMKCDDLKQNVNYFKFINLQFVFVKHYVSIANKSKVQNNVIHFYL